ncbi:MAG: O-antigen ligase family protein [Planctomycetota bacterium]|nr:O-antigen ligase family protein [Planctomycetota bacterium]
MLMNAGLRHRNTLSAVMRAGRPLPINEYMSILGVGIVLVYLLLLPPGVLGLGITALALFCGICGVSRETLGVCCLLFGMPLGGAVMEAFGIYGIGGKVVLLIGLVLLFGFGLRGETATLRLRAPVMWLAWTACVLLLSYYHGPETEYARSKIFWFAANTILTMIAVCIVVGNPKVDFWKIGSIAVICAAVYYSARICAYPVLKPQSIFILGAFRSALTESQLLASPNTLSYIASIGIAFFMGTIIDKRLSLRRQVNLLVSLGIALLVIMSCGQRKFILFPLMAAASVLLCRPRNRTLVFTITILMAIVVVTVIVFGAVGGKNFITEVLEGNETVFHRLNRDTTWDAAILRIKEKPILGHGLGGFYVDEYSRVSNRYAHNLLLEMLSEIGILGTIMIIAPPIVWFVIPSGKTILSKRTISGGTLIPLVLLTFVTAMLSAHIGKTCIVFSVVAALWAYSGPDIELRRLSKTAMQRRRSIALGDGRKRPITLKPQSI